MNPSAFVNQPAASTSAAPNGASAPAAGSTTAAAAAAGTGPANGASTPSGDVKMEGVDDSLTAAEEAARKAELLREAERERQREEIQLEKDLDLGELLDRMDEWKPVIPDEVMEYYLQKSGFETSDVRVKRLLALATQRFVSSISADAFQYARTRTAAKRDSAASAKQAAKARSRTVLTMDDLAAALKEYGVAADRAAYYL